MGLNDGSAQYYYWSTKGLFDGERIANFGGPPLSEEERILNPYPYASAFDLAYNKAIKIRNLFEFPKKNLDFLYCSLLTTSNKVKEISLLKSNLCHE